jgi:hypothetical protein
MKWVSTILVLLMPLQLWAQTKVQFDVLPPGKAVEVAGEEMRGYTLEEWLELAEADAELRKLRGDVKDLQAIVERLEDVQDQQGVVIRAIAADAEIYLRRSERCDKALKGCEIRLVKDAGGAWWSYTAAAVGAVVGVLGAVAWASSR